MSHRDNNTPHGGYREVIKMKKYFFEIQFADRTETHWTKDTSVDNARDAMWTRYGRKAITITFIKEA